MLQYAQTLISATAYSEGGTLGYEKKGAPPMPIFEPFANRQAASAGVNCARLGFSVKKPAELLVRTHHVIDQPVVQEADQHFVVDRLALLERQLVVGGGLGEGAVLPDMAFFLVGQAVAVAPGLHQLLFRVEVIGGVADQVFHDPGLNLCIPAVAEALVGVVQDVDQHLVLLVDPGNASGERIAPFQQFVSDSHDFLPCAHPVPSGFLGFVQRHVSSRTEGFKRFSRLPLCHAERACDMPDAGKLGGGNPRANGLGKIFDPVDAGFRRHDDELFASPAGQQVAVADSRLDGIDEGLDHLVARRVAVSVIDQLEMINIEEDQR